MSTALNQQTAEHLHTEPQDGASRSREQVTVNGGADPGLLPGTILGKITSSGVYVRHDSSASDGSENVAGVLFEQAIDTQRRTVHVRACTMVKAHLTYEDGADAAAITAADDALRELGIIPR